MTITVHPEVAAAVLKSGEADLYVLWAVLRAMDAQNRASGLVSVGDIIDVCAYLLGVQSNHAYRKIEEGIDKYWRRPAGERGKKTLGLLGQGKVFSRLEIAMTRAEPFALPARLFRAEEGRKNGRAIKQILIGVVAARFVDHRPVSVATLIEQTGQSESTIRNALRDCPHIVTYPNYEVLYSATERRAAVIRQRGLYAQGIPCRIEYDGGAYLVLKRIANTYLFPEPDRKPLRTRPKELRVNDTPNALAASGRIYHRGESPDPEAMNHLRKITVESNGMQSNGRESSSAEMKSADVWGRLGHARDLPESRAGKASAVRRAIQENARISLEN